MRIKDPQFLAAGDLLDVKAKLGALSTLSRMELSSPRAKRKFHLQI